MKRDPKALCRAHFQMDRSCATFENGILESYHSAIGIARTKPIISMPEEIKVYLMQRIVAMNKKAVNLNDIICHAIRKELEMLKKNTKGIGRLFLVDNSYLRFGKRMRGLGAAYCMLNQDPGKGVSSWYSKQMWVDIYSNFIKLEKGHNKARCYNQTRPKPQQEKRKPGRKSQQAANQPFNPPNADPSSTDLSAANPSLADPSSADPKQQSMGAEIIDAEIAALADMNEVNKREARRKDAEWVLEEAKKMGVYGKRGVGGWRGPSQRIANQRRKKEYPNGPRKKPDTTLDVSE
uniref:Uncharacterized protein n=1 Tax=Tanacetum cinerariifolium TaxID=118510 RepID=A0A699HZN6_TANCI|nr:hypothetical protein [Tanacetum cinerariifolium]